MPADRSTSTSAPRVSVILPVRNGARHLQAALDSLLRQSMRDFELIVLDDGSTDATPEILGGWPDERITVIRLEPRGLVASLNEGLARARGELIARQDADDVARPDRLEAQVRAFDRDPELILLGSQYDVIDDSGRILRRERIPTSDAEIRWRMLFHSALAHSAAMFRRLALEGTGLRYDATATHAEDYALWSKLIRLGSVRNLPEPLLQYRVHAEQVGQVAADSQWAAASRISRDAIAALGVQLSTEQVDALRRMHPAPTRPLTIADADHVRCMLRVLDAFVTGTVADLPVLSRVRANVVGGLAAALPVSALWSSWGRSLLRDLAAASPSGAVAGILAGRLRGLVSIVRSGAYR